MHSLGVGIVCLVVGFACGNRADEKPGVSLFDGKSLAGWEGDSAFFQVREEAIVGGSLEKPVPHNAFLCTTEEYGDFELRLKFKLLGKMANGGVQLRSERLADHFDVSGYQADLGAMYWGCLYDESRRNKVLAHPKDKKGLMGALKLDDWNDYRIRCEGKRIQLWINDVATVDYTETDEGIKQRGLIGLQIHGGGPSEAWYKDIFITELNATSR